MFNFTADYLIAELTGTVEETFNTHFKRCKYNIKALTELSIFLAHREWYWYETSKKLSRLYRKLWEKVDSYIMEEKDGKIINFNKDEVAYYLGEAD